MATSNVMDLDPDDGDYWTWDANGATTEGGPWLEDGQTIDPASIQVFLEGGQAGGPTISNITNDDTTVTAYIDAPDVEGEWIVICRVHDTRSPARKKDQRLTVRVRGTAHTP
ncbi:MAG: hypothetical protein AAGA17_00110 [Actinomycetota bacterium]